MKSIFRTQKLSLLWKVLLVLFLFQAIVLSVYAYISKQEINKRFLQEKVQLKSTSEIYFDKAINNHIFEIQDKVYALNLAGISSVDALIHHFNNQWDNLAVEWGLSGAAIYNIKQINIYQQGDINLLTVKQELEQVNSTSEPMSYVVCNELCKVHILMPLRFENETMFLKVITNLFNPISKFQNVLQLKTAIVTMNSEVNTETKLKTLQKIGNKNWLDNSFTMLRKVVNPFYYQLLNVASKQSDMHTLLSQGSRINYQQKSYFIIGFKVPLEELSTSYLIIFNDISEANKLDEEFHRSFLLFSLLTLIIMFFVILAVLWRPIARLKELRDYLPSLATDSQIKVFPTTTNSRLFIDEIDNLEQTSTDLANRLNELNNVVDKREAELKEMAMFDNLTGLANRTNFISSLKDKVANIKDDQFVTLFFIDLDRFKHINDTLGHHVGDEILKIVSKRIHNTVRDTDVVARLGGDEFTVLLSNLHSRKEVIKVVQLLLKNFEHPANVFDMTVNIQLSIGITMITDPTDAVTEVMKKADIAMYSAKNDKDKRFSFFESHMENTIVNQFNLINDFSFSLANNEFELYFQPFHSLVHDSLIGFECLIRWQHAEQGLIMPDVFLPIIKKTKYMRELEHWILEEGIKSCKQLNELSSDPLKCAINFSADIFMSKNIVQKLKHLLARFDLAPELISIEIVEDTLVQDIEAAISRCDQFRNLGVSISIDDFGVGYSSLNYLRRIPADNIKIDRSFISEIDQTETDENNTNVKVLSSLIDLILSLNKTIIAEGIETREQHNWLEKQGCSVGQGYFYDRPLIFSKAMSLVSKES